MQIFTRAKISIKKFMPCSWKSFQQSAMRFFIFRFVFGFLISCFLYHPLLQAEEWKFDFSRRLKESSEKESQEKDKGESRGPASSVKGFITSLFDSSEPMQEMVILNTEKGFIPAMVQIRLGGYYRIHVVNVNDKEKNVSFVLDSFSQHHATFFGKIKTFDIHPQKTGVFRFVSPETAAQGRLVVLQPNDLPLSNVPLRRPASGE